MEAEFSLHLLLFLCVSGSISCHSGKDLFGNSGNIFNYFSLAEGSSCFHSTSFYVLRQLLVRNMFCLFSYFPFPHVIYTSFVYHCFQSGFCVAVKNGEHYDLDISFW